MISNNTTSTGSETITCLKWTFSYSKIISLKISYMYSKIEIFPLVGSFSPIIPLAKNDLPAPVFPSNIILGTFSDPEGDPIIFEDLDSEHLPYIGRF